MPELTMRSQKNDSPRGYDLYMPRPIPGHFLGTVAQRIHDIIIPKVGENSLHMYAIANSGVPLAIGALMLSNIEQRDHASVSIIYPDLGSFEGHDLLPGETGILVDNSIHTGETLSQALEALPERARTEITTMVTVVDYEDEQHTTLVDDIQQRHGIEVVGLFKPSEVHRIAI